MPHFASCLMLGFRFSVVLLHPSTPLLAFLCVPFVFPKEQFSDVSARAYAVVTPLLGVDASSLVKHKDLNFGMPKLRTSELTCLQ